MQQDWLVRAIQASAIAIAGPLDMGRDQRVGDLILSLNGLSYPSQGPPGSIVLYYGLSDLPLQSYRYDIVKHATAMYATIITANNLLQDKSTLPWAYINLYYATFYAAHILIRTTGKAIVGLAGGELGAFNRSIANLQAGINQVSGQSFTSVFDLNLQTITFSGVSRNSHQALWHSLFETASDGFTALRQGPFRQSDIEDLNTFQSHVRNHVIGYRGVESLTASRNSVNYRFGKMLWHPNVYKGTILTSFKDAWSNSGNLSSLISRDTILNEVSVMGAICGSAHRFILSFSENDHQISRIINDNALSLFKSKLASTL